MMRAPMVMVTNRLEFALTFVGIFPMMTVVPQWTEVAEITADPAFALEQGPFALEYFMGAYGAVYRRAGGPASVR